MKLLLEGFRRGSVPSVGERSLRTRLFMDPKVLSWSLEGKSEELPPRTGLELREELGLSEALDIGLSEVLLITLREVLPIEFSEVLPIGFNDAPAFPEDGDPKRSSSMTSWRLVNERSFLPETTMKHTHTRRTRLHGVLTIAKYTSEGMACV
jgi:hypothetical protein